MSSKALTFDMRAKTGGFTSGMNTAKESASGFNSAMKTTGSTILGMGKKLATLNQHVLGIQAGFRAFNGIKTTAKDFASFEEGLLKIQAVTGATNQEMKGITGIIEELGFSTQFTTKDIQEAVFTLGTLGVKGEQAFKDLMPAITNAAVALDVDMNTAAEKVMSTIKVFNLENKDAASVIDKLAGAYTSSALNLEKFAVASQFAGLAAKTFNQPLEELLPLLQGLVDQGVDASIAGTQIRTAFLKLLKPTGEAKNAMAEAGLTLADLSVEQNGFIGVLKNAEKAQLTNAQAMSIFGVRAAPVIQALLKVKKNGKEGTEVLEEYKKAIMVTGLGAKQAAFRQQGFNFALKQVSAGAGILSVSTGKAITNFFGLEQGAKNLSGFLLDINDLMKNTDFEALGDTASNFFSSENIDENIRRALSDVAPAAFDFFGSSALYGATNLLDSLALGLPKIVSVSGSLFIKFLFKGGALFAKMIISAGKNIGLFFSNVVANIQETIGTMLLSIPGLGANGESLIQAAHNRRIGNDGFSLMAKSLEEKTDAIFTVAASEVSQKFEGLSDIVFNSTGLVKELRGAIREIRSDFGVSSASLGVKKRILESEVRTLVNDNRTQTFYNAPNRTKQLVKE